MIRFFKYSGAKLKYTNIINKYIENSKSKIYCEPFVGSGAVLFNLNKNFDRYIINDKDRNIVQMYKTFKVINYKDYTDRVQFIADKFGDIKESKEAYYNFRNWFNTNHWNKNTTEEGIYLHFLTNSCINSMLRFGPNGMNQSFGNRYYKLDYKSFEYIKNILQKTEIYCLDYKELIYKMNKDCTLYFLDPPYFIQDSSYEGFAEQDIKDFIQMLKGVEYIYTDILCSFNEHLDKELIREMRSTSPLTNKGCNGNLEYIFSNLEKFQLKEW